MKKIRNFLVILLFSFTLIGCDLRERISGPDSSDSVIVLSSPVHRNSSSGVLNQVLVTDVIDGETIIVKISEEENKTVRFAGIEIPKLIIRGQPNQSLDEEAKKFTTDKLKNTSVYIQKADGEINDKNTIVGYVWMTPPTGKNLQQIREKLFNAQLLLGGYAKIPFGADFEYISYFRICEIEARQNNTGLWQSMKTNIPAPKNYPSIAPWPLPTPTPKPAPDPIPVPKPAPDEEPVDTSENTPDLLSVDTLNAESREYAWQYNKKSFKLRIEVPGELLDRDREVFRTVNKFYASDGFTQEKMMSEMPDWMKELVISRSKLANGNLTPWVTEKTNYEYAGLLGKKLQQQAQAEGFDSYQTADFVLSFVGGAIPYLIRDTQLPAQTLIDYGDCDCKSVLLAAILKNLGYKVALLSFPNHMAVGVAFTSEQIPSGLKYSYFDHNGEKYLFAETTSPGWHIGKASPESLEKTTLFYSVD